MYTQYRVVMANGPSREQYGIANISVIIFPRVQ